MPAILVTISLLAPILVPGILLIAALKRRWWSNLATPIDGGLLLAGRPLFGPTKTWLGAAIYLLGAVAVALLLGLPALDGVSAPVFHDRPALIVGVLVGAGYTLGELANSFTKRRLGVASSTLTASRWRLAQHAIDLGDGIVVVFVVYLLLGVPLAAALTAAIAGLVVHVLTDVAMRRLRLKTR